jgi:penicillin-binding protein activator
MKILTAMTLGVLMCACSSTRYASATDEETVNADYGSTDLQAFAEGMVASLVEDPDLNYFDHPSKGDDKRVKMVFGGIENKTSEHVDTGGIRDKMKSYLVQGGKIRVLADIQGQENIGDQVRFQQGSGRVAAEQARAFGKQHGADIVVYGSLRDITKEKSRSIQRAGTKLKDRYYQFYLEAVNIETGELIWAHEEELRKRQVTGLFG